LNVLWLGLLALPSVADTLVRAVMAALARHFTSADGRPGDTLRWLVLVPSHFEGEAVAPTLRSVIAARGATSLRTVVLLDGPDPEAQAVCDLLGVETRTKQPAGPSKSAALGWAAEQLRSQLAETDAVLLLDVGSTLVPDFFTLLRWPAGAAGVQAFLAGRGEGAAAAAAYAERSAQRWDDRGRQTLGWAVRLRGTGTALTPAAFTQVVERLRTRVDDHEATLLLASAGERLVLGPPDAVVRDEKPASVRDAARQRARWLAGRYAVLLRQPGAVLRLIRRRPMEGLAFLIEILSRPFSLTAILRIAVAGVLFAAAWRTGAFGPALVAGVVLASVVADAALILRVGGVPWPGIGRLVLAWIRALPLLPYAVFHWLGARRWKDPGPEADARAAAPRVERRAPTADPTADKPTPHE
jgi:cellulose synthase/poly-beta-1,6-N-acetylglucosamine synthase-like glycosyltransferase